MARAGDGRKVGLHKGSERSNICSQRSKRKKHYNYMMNVIL